MKNLSLNAYVKQPDLQARDLSVVLAQWLRQTTVGRAYAQLASPKVPMLVVEHPDGTYSAHFMLRCELWNSFAPQLDARVVMAHDGHKAHLLPRLSPCHNCEHTLTCTLASERTESHVPAAAWLSLAKDAE